MTSVRLRWHLLCSFQRLPPPERHLLGQALCWLPLTHWGVRCLGFKRGCQFMARLSALVGSTGQSTHATLAIQRSERVLAWAIQYGLHPGNCLSRALTLWWLLRRQGVTSELRIGVRMVEGRFQAHAWLEYNGQPLHEAPNIRQHYATFAAELFTTLTPAVASATPHLSNREQG